MNNVYTIVLPERQSAVLQPWTYEVGAWSGDNWLICEVDFGEVENDDGQLVPFSGWITTDRVRASECERLGGERELKIMAASTQLAQGMIHLVDRLEKGEAIPDDLLDFCHEGLVKAGLEPMRVG